MNIVRKHNVKTEVSEHQGSAKIKRVEEMMTFSNQRPKLAPRTPLRFACIPLNNDAKDNGTLSTKDRQQLSGTRSKQRHAKTEISQTIDILKQLWNSKQQAKEEISRTISPFSLITEEPFEEQLSFKGVSNKQALFQIIESVHQETEDLFRIIAEISESKQKRVRPMSTKYSQREDEKYRFEIDCYVDEIAKQINIFQIQYFRCRNIIKTSAGITQKSLLSYRWRFQSLINGLKDKTKCLQNYTKVVKQSKLEAKQKPPKRGCQASKGSGR